MTKPAKSQALAALNADIPTKPIGLLQRFALLLGEDPDVVVFAFAPVTFIWMDGFDGRTRRYTPDFLVERRDGSRTFVSVARRTALRDDPGLDGQRGRVVAECLAVGATFEIWTEREVASAFDDRRIVLPASGACRSTYLEATKLPAIDTVPRIVESIAEKVGLRFLIRTPGGWVGCCMLTGIPMIVLPGTLRATCDGLVTWTPPLERPRKASVTAGHAARGTGASA